MESLKGMVYLCATPIGNLDDITIRVLDTLREVDIIAAEDTRHTLKLLNHFDIKKKLISCHEHNIKQRASEIIDMANQGKNIAVVTDAGMPGISDPGEKIVKLCYMENIKVTVLPGASAGISALVLSGLSTDRFVFEGFLPRIKSERTERIMALKNETRTALLYESPFRIRALLDEIQQLLGDRQIAIIRELTKLHEEVIRGDIEYVKEHFDTYKPKGEFVIVVEGILKKSDEYFENLTIKEHIIQYMNLGFSKKEAVKHVAEERNVPKREIYKHSIDM